MSEQQSVEDIIRALVALEVPNYPEGYSAYQLAGIFNELATAAELKTVTSQMMYNYSRNGMIVPKSPSHNGHRYTSEEVVQFLVRFAKRRILAQRLNEIEI